MLSIMEKKKSFIINSIYIAVWILIIYFLITFASAYLLPFLIGIIIAHLVQKPAVFMNKKIGIKKNKCAAILSVTIYLFVSIIIFLFFLTVIINKVLFGFLAEINNTFFS